MSEQTIKSCAITGASGYVGSRISRFFKSHGIRVIEMGRSAQTPHGIPFQLGKDFDHKLLASADVLVHCAYDFGAIKWDEIYKRNVQGTIRLFEAARAAGVKKLIFISSISAFDGCKSLYGRAKLKAERAVLEMGGTVIRPGLVYGEGEELGGMVGSLSKVVKKAQMIPVVGASQKLFLCHEDDLAQLVYDLAVGAKMPPAQPLIAASSHAYSFGEILKILGQRKGKKIFLVPISWRMTWMGLKMFETLGVRVGFRSDSLTSLMNPDPKPNFNVSKDLGAEFRNFN